MVDLAMAALMPDSITASAARCMWTPPESAKEVVPDLIISRQASFALQYTSSGVRVLSKGTRKRVQIMGYSSASLPLSSCWQVWVWASTNPGISSLPRPSRVSRGVYCSSASPALPMKAI